MGFIINNGVLKKYNWERGVTEVVVPDGVTNIGDGAFNDCFNLTSITMPDSVASIGRLAFGHCRNLISISIPAGVTFIDEYAFHDCSGLASITVSPGNRHFRSNGNCLINTETKCLIAGCSSSVIPSDGSVTSIGDYAFYCCKNLAAITIPDSVTSIGKEAFFGCEKLAEVVLPVTLTDIGKDAFGKFKSFDYFDFDNDSVELYIRFSSKIKSKSKLPPFSEVGKYLDNFIYSTTPFKDEEPALEIAETDFEDEEDTLEYEGFLIDDEKAFEDEELAWIYLYQSSGWMKYASIDLKSSLGISYSLDKEKKPQDINFDILYDILDKEPKVGRSQGDRLFALLLNADGEIHKNISSKTLLQMYSFLEKKRCPDILEKMKLHSRVQEAIKGKSNSKSPSSVRKPVKLNAEEKRKCVMRLENMLLEHSDKIKDEVETWSPYEFTARSLGIACRLYDTATVDILLDHGFTPVFSEKLSKYDVFYKPTTQKYIAEYLLLAVIRDDICSKYYLAGMEQYVGKYQVHHFDEYTFMSTVTMNLPDSLKCIDESIRCENLRHVIELCPGISSQSLGLLLYFAIMERQTAIRDMLIGHGATLACCTWLCSGLSTDVVKKKGFIERLFAIKEDSDSAAVLDDLVSKLKSVNLTAAFSENNYYELSEKPKTRLVILKNKLTKIPMKALLQNEIESDSVENVVALLELGAVSNKKIGEEMLTLALNGQKTEIAALLLEYKNRKGSSSSGDAFSRLKL